MSWVLSEFFGHTARSQIKGGLAVQLNPLMKESVVRDLFNVSEVSELGALDGTVRPTQVESCRLVSALTGC